MRSFALVSLFVSLVGACGGSPPGGGTDSESGTSGSTGSTSSPTTTTNTTNNPCTPGQSIPCTCNDGQSGAQVCVGGTFDACECIGGTSDSTTTTTTTTSSSTTDLSTSTTDLTASSSGGSSSGSTGGSSSGGSSSGGVGQSYGPCPSGDDAECQPGETCVTGMSMMGMWSICTEGTCQDGGDCSTDLCTDAPGDGMFQLYCLLQTCNMQNPCPMGMTCFPGFGMGTPAVCLWGQ